MVRRLMLWALWTFLAVGILAIVSLAAFLLYAQSTAQSPYRIHVSGRVTDSLGNPIPSARVIAEPQSVECIPPQDAIPRIAGLAKRKTALTDSNGRYEFKGLIAGRCPILSDGWFEKLPWRIVADAEGAAPRQAEIGHVPVGRIFHRNKSFSNLDFALERELRILGRAVDTRGKPLAGRYIQPVLQGEPVNGNTEKTLPAPVKTDADGRFEFNNLSPGVYNFRGEGYPGDVYLWWRHEEEGFVVPQIAMSDPIKLAAGKSMEGIEAVFESPEDRGNIAGQVVTAATGEPITGFTVKMTGMTLSGGGTPVLGHVLQDNERKRVFLHNAFQGEAGNFQIEEISPGTATLEVDSPGYATTKTTVQVPRGRTIEMTFPLAPETQLEGTASYKKKPSPRASVSLFTGPEH